MIVAWLLGEQVTGLEQLSNNGDMLAYIPFYSKARRIKQQIRISLKRQRRNQHRLGNGGVRKSV
jgi:hypothetical protein